MASADFSASSFRRYRRPWPFRADGEISRNKTHFFRPAGCGFTTLLRLGLGLRLVLQTCPQVGLVSAFCAYPPNFASDFLHPRPRGRKLVLGYLVPPNWPIGDFHSRPCVMSCVQKGGEPDLARLLFGPSLRVLRWRLEGGVQKTNESTALCSWRRRRSCRRARKPKEQGVKHA